MLEAVVVTLAAAALGITWAATLGKTGVPEFINLAANNAALIYAGGVMFGNLPWEPLAGAVLAAAGYLGTNAVLARIERKLGEA